MFNIRNKYYGKSNISISINGHILTHLLWAHSCTNMTHHMNT